MNNSKSNLHQHPTAPTRNVWGSFSPATDPSNNLFGSQAATLSREEVKNEIQEELDDKIYELPNDLLKLQLGGALAGLFGPEADDIVDE